MKEGRAADEGVGEAHRKLGAGVKAVAEGVEGGRALVRGERVRSSRRTRLKQMTTTTVR